MIIEYLDPWGSGLRSVIAPYSPTYMGGCQNYGPLLGTLNSRCRIIIRTPKGILILTTTHIFCFIVPSKPHSD